MKERVEKKIIRKMKLSCVSLDYQINPKGRMGEIICVEYFVYKVNKKPFLRITAVGKAKCNPEHDTFDENVGKKIARARAEKKAFKIFKRCIDKEIKIQKKQLDILIQNSEEILANQIEHQEEYIKELCKKK